MMGVLLCGYLPFLGENNADVLAKVRLGNFSSDTSNRKDIPEDLKGLIRMLLKMNPKATGVSLQAGFANHLRSFRGQTNLEKAAEKLSMMAGC